MVRVRARARARVRVRLSSPLHAHQHVGGAHGAHVGGEAVPPELVRLAARARPARAQLEQLRKVGDAPPASAVLVERLRAVDEEDAQRRGRCGRQRGRQRGRRGRRAGRRGRRVREGLWAEPGPMLLDQG